MESAYETPCPVSGLVCPTTGPTSAVIRTLVVYREKPASSTKPTGARGTSSSLAAVTLPLGASTTLDSVYEGVQRGFIPMLDTSQSFCICSTATGLPLKLRDIHAGCDLIAYVEDGRASPHLGQPPESLPIPAGPRHKLLGKNFADLRPLICSAHLRLMHQYGPIFRITMPPNTEAVVICDPDLAGQVIEKPEVWPKTHFKHNKMVRTWVNRGLFTADDDEEIWGIAHRILLPAFSNQGMKQYFNVVQQCIERLFVNWDGMAERNQPVDLTKCTEMFTFDVIGRVGFGHDFKAQETGTHPYLEQLQKASNYSDARWGRGFLRTVLTQAKSLREWSALNQPNVKFVDTIVAERQAELEKGIRTDEKDVLTLMLTAADPQTGQRLPPDNVRDQILTFLLAGHDSTSTAITCLFMLLSQHGDVERKVMEEVERVVGNGPLTFEKLGQLQYCTCVINESLRLFPPAQASRKDAAVDTMLGPYKIPKGMAAIVSLWGLSHNPVHWPDPWKFDPDRWLPERAKNRSPFASLPFSAGHRGCLGRQLSIMEQRSVLARTVQRYHLRLHSLSKPSFTTPLFLKPHGVFISLELRQVSYLSTRLGPSLSDASLARSIPVAAAATVAGAGAPVASGAGKGVMVDATAIPPDTRLLVLYGSNMGTCETFAGELAQHAVKIGMATISMSLDAFLEKKEMTKGAAAVIIISSTYNGTPPDNASRFMKFLEEPVEVAKVFAGVHFSVFGCGNTQWTRTYQAVPRAIDKALVAAQGKRLTADFACGNADSALDEEYETWKFALWEGLSKSLGISGAQVQPVSGAAGLVPAYVVTLLPGKRKEHQVEKAREFGDVASKWAMKNGLFIGKVLENRELQGTASDRSTRHIEIQLAPEQHYTAGDHLAVQGGNPAEVVARAAAVLEMKLDDMLHVHKASPQVATSSTIPFGVDLTVELILTWCVELQHTVPRAQLAILIDRATCPPEKKALEAMMGAYDTEVNQKKRTLIELLDAYRSTKLTLAELCTLLPPLRPRYYSISSSPLIDAEKASVTVGVVKGYTPTGRLHLGVVSNYLAGLKAGQQVRVFVKDTKSNFRLPPTGTTPIILIGPGTGVAPLRGFLYDREASKATGPAVLFFGCRQDDDFIYREEMEGFKARGVLQELEVAFSRKVPGQRVYVQQLLERKARMLFQMLEAGGHVYVCGDAKHMAPDVRAAIAKILAEGKGLPLTHGPCLVEELVTEKRYLEDVWASG